MRRAGVSWGNGVPRTIKSGGWRWILLVVLCLSLAGALVLISCQQAGGRFLETHDPGRAESLSSQACLECHTEQVAEWRRSHHAMANRLVSFSKDSAAFQLRQEVDLGSRTVGPTLNGNRLIFTEAGESAAEVASPVGVIGVDPLWQHLIPVGKGKFQAYSVTFDPQHNEWFYVFDDDVRLPGEWGHWTGQGMNWNANCAYCHMTEYHKNLVHDGEPEVRYQSTWLHQGITCVQCHPGMDAHVANPQAPIPDSQNGFSKVQIEHSCATCHSRREELTPEAFHAGDSFHDHYNLSLVDQGSIYHPDGQVNNENFVFTSMRLNKMGHAGISCLDCHNPHSAELILPAENNALCLKCHASGEEGATVIEPVKHSFHPAGSTGATCIECHMPVNSFMSRDDRRDHIFYSPDPRLSQELGSPDTCTNCHQDQTLEWAAQWREKWWPIDDDQWNRRRARAIHAFRTGSPGGHDALLSLARSEENHAWKASLTGMLGPFVQWPEVLDYLEEALAHESPLVRAAAVRSLSSHPDAPSLLAGALNDPVRVVRIQAARVVGTDPGEGTEYADYLLFNADRPGGALSLAEQSLSNPDELRQWVERAVALEPANPVVYADGGVLKARGGDLEGARKLLLRGLEHDPGSATLAFDLGLVDAERGDLLSARDWLLQAVENDPQMSRAWYNLALIYQKTNNPRAAREAAEKAFQLNPNRPEYRQLLNFF